MPSVERAAVVVHSRKDVTAALGRANGDLARASAFAGQERAASARLWLGRAGRALRAFARALECAL